MVQSSRISCPFIVHGEKRTGMHELLSAWRDRKGLALIGATALLYALVLVPFNQLALTFAGISIRPAAALPVVLGILFGPAAAWGCGIGNVAGDLSGSWSPMSVFGFLVNFLLPYLSYLFWHRLVKGRVARVNFRTVGSYLLVAFVVTLACMGLLAACGTIFFGRPFWSKFISYFGNNIFWAVTAGTVLFWLSIGPAVRKGLVYGKEWTEKSTTAVP